MTGRIGALCGALVAVGALVAACGVSSATDTKWADPTTISYYAGLHVNLARMTKTSSGVFYWDSIAGPAGTAAQTGDQLSVHYTLWLPNGTQLESGTYAFTMGTGVIPGWSDGLTGATQGTLRQLVIPPAMAYGDAGQGSVPANATLIFLINVDRLTRPSSTVAGPTTSR